MHRRRTSRRAVTAAVLATALGLTLQSAPALAGTASSAVTVDLPIASYTTMAVDDTHGRVFLTDPRGDSIVVTDTDGTVTHHITGMPGASWTALSRDDSVLYVSLADTDANAIVAIDTGTLTETARYELGDTTPSSLALTSTTLWFSYTEDGWGNIGSIELGGLGATLHSLTGRQPEVTKGHLEPYTWYGSLQLKASPNDPTTLVAGMPGQTPVEIAVYDVTGGSIELRAYKRNPGENGSGNLSDLAVTPDGREVVLASGSPYHHHAYSTKDLSATRTYDTATYPNSVAVAGNGMVAAGVNGTYNPDVYLFRPDGGTPFKEFDFPRRSGGDQTLVERGLGWTDDRSRLFAVVRTSYGDPLGLRVIHDPTA